MWKKDVGVLGGDGCLEELWANGMGILDMGLLRCCEKSKSLRDMGNRKDGCPALIYMRAGSGTGKLPGCRMGEDLDGNRPILAHLALPRPLPSS